jgi:hypothetical protein
MIDIRDINDTELLTTDLGLFPKLDLIADSEDYLKEISNQEKDKIHGGIWISNGCERYWIK